MKTSLQNMAKIAALAAVGAVLILLCSFLPGTELLGVELKSFVVCFLIDLILFVAVGLTGHLYGGCVLAFLLPVLRYYLAGMMSPVLMIPQIMAECFMLLFFCLVVQKRKPVFLLIGYIGASAVKYAVLWLVVNKVLTRYSSLVTLFQNLDNEAAEQAAISLMKAQMLHGQLVCALLGGLTAFLLLPMLKEFLRRKSRG